MSGYKVRIWLLDFMREAWAVSAKINWRGISLIAVCEFSCVFSVFLILTYWDYGQRFEHLHLEGGPAFAVYAEVNVLSLLNAVLGCVACLFLVWEIFRKNWLRRWVYHLIALVFLSPWLYLLYQFVHRSLSTHVP